MVLEVTGTTVDKKNGILAASTLSYAGQQEELHHQSHVSRRPRWKRFTFKQLELRPKVSIKDQRHTGAYVETRTRPATSASLPSTLICIVLIGDCIHALCIPGSIANLNTHRTVHLHKCTNRQYPTMTLAPHTTQTGASPLVRASARIVNLRGASRIPSSIHSFGGTVLYVGSRSIDTPILQLISEQSAAKPRNSSNGDRALDASHIVICTT